MSSFLLKIGNCLSFKFASNKKEANAYHFRLNRETLEQLKAEFVCENESKPHGVLFKNINYNVLLWEILAT